MTKVCENKNCKKEFITNRKQKKFCCIRCRRDSEGKSVRSAWAVLATGTVGAIQELRVSIDLLKNGWEVYRALSPAASCDLLALKLGLMIKIEVRTGYRGTNNRLIFSKNNVRADYIAVALPEEIVYLPDIPIRTSETDRKK